MRMILAYAKPYKWKIIQAMTVKFTGSMAELLIPWILSKLVDEIIPMKVPAWIWLFGGLMLTASLGACGLNIGANRLASGASRRITQDLRDDLFQQMTQISQSQFQQITLPSMISRVTSDSYNIHQFINMMMRMGVRAPILTVGGLIMSFVLDPVLALAIVALLPFMVLLLVTVYRLSQPLFLQAQRLADDIVRVVRDDIAGIRVVKAFGKEEEENRRFWEVNDAAARKDQQAGQTTAVLNPGMNLCLNLGMVLAVVLGAFRVNSGDTMAGELIAMLSYMTLILNGMLFLSRFFRSYAKASASASRIQSVLFLQPPDFGGSRNRAKCYEADRENTESPSGEKDRGETHIVFEDVTFSYRKGKGSPDLSHISFTVKRGETLGIIGPTGAGKTTVVNLLIRFFFPDSGRILIDGTDIREMGEHELRARFGAALQKDFLFQDTMEGNIRLGRQLEDSEIHEALRVAQAEDFAMEKGMGELLNIRGANLSGGQKQRIMLARALAGRPEILILDDSSSALDYATDARFRAALAGRDGQCTVIMIAQRISSIMHAEQILVLDEGKEAGLGTHEQLLRTCLLYQEMYEIQMGEGTL